MLSNWSTSKSCFLWAGYVKGKIWCNISILINILWYPWVFGRYHEENNYAGHFTKWNASDCECLVFQNALQDITLLKCTKKILEVFPSFYNVLVGTRDLRTLWSPLVSLNLVHVLVFFRNFYLFYFLFLCVFCFYYYFV